MLELATVEIGVWAPGGFSIRACSRTAAPAAFREERASGASRCTAARGRTGPKSAMGHLLGG